MRHLIVASCRMKPETTREFLGEIQHWEQAAMASEHSPHYHALYVSETDPSQVLLITHFESREHAEAFASTGLLDRFRAHILPCVEGQPLQDAYDLYYSVGPGGPRVVFGEEPGSA